MNQERTSMTPPWIPVGLSTLVLLGLVVVLSLSPSSPQRPTEVITPTTGPTSTSLPHTNLITKILWRTPTTLQVHGNQNSGNGNFSDTYPAVSPTTPVTGEVLASPFDVSVVGVSGGQHIRVSMTPLGDLNLQCGETATPVDFDFIVPSTQASCLLEITGVTGTLWKVEELS